MVFTFEFGQSQLSPPDVRRPVEMGEHLAPVEYRPHALRVERRLHDRRALTPDAGQFAERHVAPLVRLAGLARRPPRCIRPGSPLHVIREAFRAFGHPALGQTWRAIRPAPGSHRTPAHVETSDRFCEHLNGLLNGKLAAPDLRTEGYHRMVRPALLVEPPRRPWNVPRSNIAPRFLVARKLPHRRDQDFRIDARLDQRTELPLGRFARVRSIAWRIGLPKFLEFFARIRAARVSDRPREILILDSGFLALSFGISGG